MKKIISFILVALLIIATASCGKIHNDTSGDYGKEPGMPPSASNGEMGAPSNGNSGGQGSTNDSDASFGEDITDEIEGGYFDDEEGEIEVICHEGTDNAYTLENGTLTITQLREDSVYSVSGKLRGNIVIDIGEGSKLELELSSLSIISENESPITVLSGDKVIIQAKKDTKSYIYDERDTVTDEENNPASIISLVDLEISGKGELFVSSKSNNGIHSKKDLTVKSLTLTVNCVDNALKGNDSVTIESGATTLIATGGDGIKTTNSDISSKGNQRGTVAILSGSHNIYSACDGIDSAYNVVISGSDTSVNIYTDKYSNYSSTVKDNDGATDANLYYIRYTSDLYKYSVKYYNSDEDYVWASVTYHSEVTSGRGSYYYYSFEKKTDYSKMQVFIYSSDMEGEQEESYIAKTDYLSINDAYDTFALSQRWGGLSYNWTNYTTNIQEGGFGGGFGGMNDGNSDKGSYSTKGIKSCNEIIINDGSISIKAYDDAIHAKNDEELENGETPLGNITINGGSIALYSNDDGIHADNSLTLNNGTVTITNSYEGIEGKSVAIKGGSLSVVSKDDGINGTATEDTSIEISGGRVYIYCNGDGIDSNSRASYSGIVFSGGDTVVISTSGGNSAIDTERGYSFTGGRVIAIMPQGGMSSEATNCQGFSTIGKVISISLSKDSYLKVSGNEQIIATLKMPTSINGRVIYLGSADVICQEDGITQYTLDSNGVYWSN
ncbi:MAG: carbohydrate-binding domain-containing protein [Clostridia bacterium]|nr:carbohydrate-binding domain-containing protein [Clostridia bacterium]